MADTINRGLDISPVVDLSFPSGLAKGPDLSGSGGTPVGPQLLATEAGVILTTEAGVAIQTET